MLRLPQSIPYPVLLLVVIVGGGLTFLNAQNVKPITSNWGLQQNAAAAMRADVQDTTAAVVSTAMPTVVASTPIAGVAAPQGSGQAALDSYLAASVVREQVGEGWVRFAQRDVAGGAIDLMVVRLNEATHVEVINADGATPTSDATGDTLWADGQRHLAKVQDMANAPYAVREGYELLGAIAFGFHGAARTSNEGTVVINGQVLRSNPGRGTFCITHERHAQIGKFSTEELSRCAQAIGGGPVILWENKVANTDVAAAEGEFLPFNPLGEDFVQLDWRKKIYNGRYPKTAVGIGLLENGTSFIVLATSHNMLGIDLARQLRDMGCYAALGGDDDTSTQAVWRGALVRPTNPRSVPDAIGVYVRG